MIRRKSHHRRPDPLLLLVIAVDFTELVDAHEGRFFTGVGTLNFQELECVRHAGCCSGREPGFYQLTDFSHIGATLELGFERPHQLAHVLDRLGTGGGNGLFYEIVDLGI